LLQINGPAFKGQLQPLTQSIHEHKD